MKKLSNRIKMFLLVLFTIIQNIGLYSEEVKFDIKLEAVKFDALGGLQSFAFGHYNGKWLIVGGRLDGLHQRQPFAAFDQSGHNTLIFVVDPILKQKWTASINTLPIAIKEQLKSTNMEFYQIDKYLYCFGGYGYSESKGDHTTFDKLTAIDIPATIDAVINNKNLTPYFRQITDSKFQITGGGIEKINNTLYLVGGQKFIGRYNPMGPNNGPGFIQEYSTEIKKFNIIDDGINIRIEHLATFSDANNLHRRDYNLNPQIIPNGEEGITAFSGVFQKTVNLPFLNCVNIDSNSFKVNNNFSQYYNHYHCATVGLYSASNNEMHNIFYGGIAQYYDSLGILTQNNDVPFVKTIARVTRNALGEMSEYKLPVEMPSYLGTGSEFIINEELPMYNNGVLKYDELKNDTTMIGYIYGGIVSSAPSIFFVNNGTQSQASSQLFKVFLIKNNTTGIHLLNEQSIGSLKLQIFPNPNKGIFTIKYNLNKESDVNIKIYTIDGKKILDKIIPNQTIGEKIHQIDEMSIENSETYILTIKTNQETATQKINIEK